MAHPPKVRTNGFERPFHPFQVFSWILFGLDVIIYALCNWPLIENLVARIVVGVCYAISVIQVIVATAKATRCDPIDPHVRSQAELPGDEIDSLPICLECNVPVYARSKHCRTCNKCVTVFDHHCIWINNCVGSANYRAFFMMVSSVAVMTGTLLATCFYLLVDYIVNEDNFEQRAADHLRFENIPSDVAKKFLLGTIIALITVNGPLFLLDMQLVLLHISLMSQHLTTYEYIVNKRNKQDEPSRGEGAERRKVMRLPSCMDWIIFCKCGRRSKKRKGATADHPKTTVVADDTEVPGLGGPNDQVVKSCLSDGSQGGSIGTWSHDLSCTASKELSCATLLADEGKAQDLDDMKPAKPEAPREGAPTSTGGLAADSVVPPGCGPRGTGSLAPGSGSAREAGRRSNGNTLGMITHFKRCLYMWVV